MNNLLTPADGEAFLYQLRVMSQFDPFVCVKTVLNNPDIVEHLHGHDLELTIKRMMRGIRHQAIEWPRIFFKTTTFTKGLSTWLVLPSNDEDRKFAINALGYDAAEWDRRAKLRNQDYTQLLAFENLENAKRKVGEIRSCFETNETFRECFPEIAYRGDENPWNNECLKIRRVGRNRYVDEGTFEAKGAGNALQSGHWDIIWEDDIFGKRALLSDAERESTIHWHRLLSGVEQPKRRTFRFLVSNRWGFNDLNSHVREEKDGRGRKKWFFYTRRAYEMDPVTGQEVPIFPEQYPMDVIADKREEFGIDFPAQFMNDPRPGGFTEVSSERIHVYTVDLATGRMHCNCGKSFLPSELNRYMHFDPYNAKGKLSRSMPAIAVVGLSTCKHALLLDYYMAKGSYAQITDKLFEMNWRWQPIMLSYEDVMGQNMWEFHLREREAQPEFRLQKHNRPFDRIVPVSTASKVTEVRIRESLLPILSGKNGVTFAARDTHRLFFDMVETWPATVPGHDYDLLSALEQGPGKRPTHSQLWRFPADESQEEIEREYDQEYLQKFGVPYSRYQVRHQGVVQ